MLMLSGVVLLVNVPAQAPVQAQIAFQSDRDGNWEIYVIDADGNNPRNLTNNPADDVFPDWFDPAFALIPLSPLLATSEEHGDALSKPANSTALSTDILDIFVKPDVAQQRHIGVFCITLIRST